MISRVGTAIRLLWREVAKFGIIGILNSVVDLGLFNVLIAGPMQHKVTTAKFVSGGIATVLAWLGNRYWTFRDRPKRALREEAVLFFVVNGVALLITTGWVAFAHYALHAESKLMLNMHTVIGIGLGTLFRFWTYHKFVFATDPEIGENAVDEDETASAGAKTTTGGKHISTHSSAASARH